MKHRKTALIEAGQYRPGLEDGIDEKGPYLDTLEDRLLGWGILKQNEKRYQ